MGAGAMTDRWHAELAGGAVAGLLAGALIAAAMQERDLSVEVTGIAGFDSSGLELVAHLLLAGIGGVGLCRDLPLPARELRDDHRLRRGLRPAAVGRRNADAAAAARGRQPDVVGRGRFCRFPKPRRPPDVWRDHRPGAAPRPLRPRGPVFPRMSIQPARNLGIGS